MLTDITNLIQIKRGAALRRNTPLIGDLPSHPQPLPLAEQGASRSRTGSWRYVMIATITAVLTVHVGSETAFAQVAWWNAPNEEIFPEAISEPEPQPPQASQPKLVTTAGIDPIVVEPNIPQTLEPAAPVELVERGMASWYGPGFAGKLTASGERFDPNLLTAAHPTLPFGTVVEVKNIRLNRTVELVINDRGPFKNDRIIDVSAAAAKKLGFYLDGITMTEVRVLQKTAADLPKVALPVASNYVVQVASYTQRARATRLQQALNSHGQYLFAVQQRPQGQYAVISTNQFDDRTSAQEFARQIMLIKELPIRETWVRN